MFYALGTPLASLSPPPAPPRTPRSESTATARLHGARQPGTHARYAVCCLSVTLPERLRRSA